MFVMIVFAGRSVCFANHALFVVLRVKAKIECDNAQKADEDCERNAIMKMLLLKNWKQFAKDC